MTKLSPLLLSFLVFIIFTSAAHAWEGPFFDKTSSEYGQVCDFYGTETEVTFRKTDKLCNKHVFYEYEGENGKRVTIPYHITNRDYGEAYYYPGELCAFMRHSLDPKTSDRYFLFYHYRKHSRESCSATVSDKALEDPCTIASDKASEDLCTTASDKYPKEIPPTFQAQHPLIAGLKSQDKLKVFSIKLEHTIRHLDCNDIEIELPLLVIDLLKKLKLNTK